MQNGIKIDYGLSGLKIWDEPIKKSRKKAAAATALVFVFGVMVLKLHLSDFRQRDRFCAAY
jgi:hypothetical protein